MTMQSQFPKSTFDSRFKTETSYQRPLKIKALRDVVPRSYSKKTLIQNPRLPSILLATNI